MLPLTVVAFTFLFVFAVYLWLVCPSLKKRDVSFLCEKPVAHRGIHDREDVTENSITAFALAIKAGLPIELDVHLTSDGVPVVLHDSSLSRVCGADENISDLSIAELSKHRFIRGGETIPTLEMVLELVNGQVPLLIELKGEDTSSVAEDTARVMAHYVGKYAVQSFNPYYLYRYRKVSPETPIGILSNRRRGKGLRGKLFALFATHLLFNFAYRPDFISYIHSDKMPQSVKLCRKLGAKVLVWTVTDAEAYSKCTKRYDGVIAEKIAEITK